MLDLEKIKIMKMCERIKNQHRHTCKNFPICKNAAYMYNDLCYRCYRYKTSGKNPPKYRTDYKKITGKRTKKVDSIEDFMKIIKKYEI